MLLRLLFSFTILFIPLASLNAQDTLVYCLKKNRAKEFKIPIAQYNIKLKTKAHKKYNLWISACKDSVLQCRIKSSTRQSKKELKDLYTRADTTKYPAGFTNAQFDSVLKTIKAQAVVIEYPTEITIALKDVAKFKINNSDRPEKRKLMKAVNLIGFVLVPGMFFVPAAGNDVASGIMFGVTGAWAITAMAIKTKTINVKKKWVLRKITSSQ